MSIEVANESGVEVDEATLVTLSRLVLDRMNVHPLAELSVMIVDEPTMAELNEQWMGEQRPTDVLAFPMDELRPGLGTPRGEDSGQPGPELLGDIVLCPQVAERQAKEAGHSTDDELRLLCTHGILHLLGYDHAEPDEQAEMFGLQRDLLKQWRESREPQ